MLMLLYSCELQAEQVTFEIFQFQLHLYSAFYKIVTKQLYKGPWPKTPAEQDPVARKNSLRTGFYISKFHTFPDSNFPDFSVDFSEHIWHPSTNS